MIDQAQELYTVVVTKTKHIPRGALRYSNVPRVGEWVEIIDQDDAANIMCEVIMVVHSTSGGAADVYLKEVSGATDAIRSLKYRA
jgi:hypothetical protein